MRVYELVAKKMDEMNERDFWELIDDIGTQFAFVLDKVLGIKSFDAVSRNLTSVLWRVEVVEVSSMEFMFIYDTEQLREQLYRGVS